ncbi:hypothetical protein C9J85_09410 [Haloferax sp. wsp5]|nr:hypothetical protein C9J85_09410 [Haloferax sp. wsp5]
MANLGGERVAVDRRPDPHLVVVDVLGRATVSSGSRPVRPVVGEFVVRGIVEVTSFDDNCSRLQ